LALTFAVAVASVANAQIQTITFDDLNAPAFGTPIQPGYAGFDWTDFGVANTQLFTQATGGPSGYENGTVSQPNAAYSEYENPTSFSPASGGTLSLVSAYLTGAWNDGLQVTVDGYSGATVVDSTTVTVNATGPSFEVFDFPAVTSVMISSSGGTQHPGYNGSGTYFVMDNLAVATGNAMFWASPTGGSWDSPTNWNPTGPPASANDVIINPTNSIAVTGPHGAATINSLTLGGGGGNAVLSLQSSGNLSVTNDVTIQPGATLNTSGAIVTAGSLSIAAGGVVNVNGAIVLTSDGGNAQTAEAAIQQFIANGSITTTSGLDIAYADGSDGVVARLPAGEIVIEPALPGDTDLSGTVDIHDLQNLLGDFNAAGFWDQGNFNGHAVVDISDVQALLSNFNSSTSLSYSELNGIENLVGTFGYTATANPDGTGFSLVAVPEPTSVVVMAAGIGLLARRRSRGRRMNQRCVSPAPLSPAS
jgi:adhesin HecA-like repeat protein